MGPALSVVRSCVRVARCAPWLPVDEAATAAGASPKSMTKTLERLEPRGGCAAVATRLAIDGSVDIYIRQRALEHPAAPPSTLRAATRHTSRPTLTTAGAGSAAWAGRRQLSQTIRPQMALVAGFSDPDRRRQATSGGVSAAAILRRLADDEADIIRVDVAAHQHCPPDALARLSTDAHGRARIATANNPNTPAVTLSVLASDPSSSARRGVANNPSSTSEILTGLVASAGSGRSGDKLRSCVAANPNCSAGLLERLSGSEDDDIRFAAAANPNASHEMLDRCAGSNDQWLLYGTAHNPACPPLLLERLSGHAHDWARRGVAENPATPPGLLVDLAADRWTNVHHALIERSDLPRTALLVLTSSPSQRVADKARELYDLAMQADASVGQRPLGR